MIAKFWPIPKATLLRGLQAVAILLSMAVVLSFLRHSLVTSSSSFRKDFERQSFIELSRGETFLVARKLAALAKGEQINCVMAQKKGIIFFEERKGDCRPSFFRTQEVVVEPNQDIRIEFTISLQQELFLGFLAFLAVQLTLAGATFLAQRQAILADHRRDLDLADLARQVGHDIRSPLAVLRTCLLGEAKGVDPRISQRALDHLSQLVQHLLGQKESDSRKMTLETLLQEAVQEKQMEAGSHMELNLEIEESLKRIHPPGDAFLWRRVLSNLLNNAWEASSGVAKVKVSIERENGGWVLTVKDQGKGIPAEILSKVGTKGLSFGKGRNSGLGLSSAREFALSLGGQLEVWSKLGQGTQVMLHFPLESTQKVILIEDDPALAQVWKIVASKKGVELKHYSSPEDFLLHAGQIGRTTPIYLDVEFPNSKRDALQFGEELSRMGFTQIHLTTGHPPEKFTRQSWVRSVRGKEPPWS